MCEDSNYEDAPDAAVNVKEYLASMENDQQNDEDSFDVVDSKEKNDDHQSWEDVSVHD